MKKILIVYPGFPHYRKGVIEELINSQEIDFTFIGDKNMMGSNIKPYIFPPNSKFINTPSYYIGPFLFHKKMFSFISRTEFDGYIFHSGPYWISIFLCVCLLKIKKQIILNWTHGILSKQKGIRNKLYKWFYNLFDGILLYGNHARKNMINMGINPNKLFVIFNSLDYFTQIKFRNSLTEKQLMKFRNDLFQNPQYPQLLFIGRLTKQKKLHLLIEGLEQLKKNDKDYNLLIVGSGGEEETALKENVINKGLSQQVLFYGASYDDEENYKLIASSDCCISPGEVGLTAIHSLMFGTPVITHNNIDRQMPEMEAIVPGKNGDLFKDNNVEDFVDTICKWFSFNKERGKVKTRCYETIDKTYNPTNQIKLIEKVLDSLITVPKT